MFFNALSIAYLCNSICYVILSVMQELIQSIDLKYSASLVALAIMVALWLLGKRPMAKFISKNLFLFAGLILVAGFLLYFIGYNNIVDKDEVRNGSYNNPFALVPRAMLSAFEMFASRSDLRMVNTDLQNDFCYMSIFSLTHFFAVAVSAVFVINLFGLRFKNWCRKIWWNLTRWFDNTNGTYVLWGINESSLNLAKDIRNNESIHKARIVFVHTKDDSVDVHKHSGRKFSFNGLFDFANHDNAEIDDIIYNIKGYVLRCNDINALARIKSMLKKDVHIIFLSDDEHSNLQTAFALDNLVFLKNNEHVKYYCHAQRNLLNKRQTDDERFKLIDSSYLSVLELRQNKDAHPVNFVDIEEIGGLRTGVVTSKFTGLVLGFNDTGQEALSYLYEFSAFVGVNGERSPYRLIAIDRDMHKQKADFISQRPALKNNYNIGLVSAEVGSMHYWNIIDNLVRDGLNYIIVALGSDKLNLSVAIQLLEHIMRRSDFAHDKLCVYVKQSREIDASIKAIYGDKLRCFGTDKNIFTWKIVSNEKYEKEAVQYAKRYDVLSRNYERESNHNSTSSNTTPLEYKRNRERKYSQNLSNAYHRHTKIHLIGEPRATELYVYKRTPQYVDEYMDGYKYYNQDLAGTNDVVTTLMTTLAKCEHLRWNALMEMLGYTQNIANRKVCNSITMEHNCLTSWDDLHNIWESEKIEYKCYDYNVVETSIALQCEEYK